MRGKNIKRLVWTKNGTTKFYFEDPTWRQEMNVASHLHTEQVRSTFVILDQDDSKQNSDF